MSTTLGPTAEQLTALTSRPADAPVLMVNLLKFETTGGLESYQRYAREVAPHLERVGATLRYAGTAPGVVIGDGERPWWDAILVVEYPTPQAFIDMVTTPDYANVHQHRGAGTRRFDRDVGLVNRNGLISPGPGGGAGSPVGRGRAASRSARRRRPH